MFHHESYKRQAESFAADVVDPKRIKIAATWFDETTADYWRHHRFYEIADYLGGVPGEQWVTVGDGRFGLDAIRLKKRGVSEVMATDIDETLLRVSHDKGDLPNYSVENAEKLSFEDASFDYAFCKEAYHHFPRPALALYEMLRVTRKGVILAEPNDRKNSVLRMLKAGVKRLLGRGSHMDQSAYEDAGNYIYSISPREIEKVALGINLPQVAFKGLNDRYFGGMEFSPLDSPVGKRVRSFVARRDFVCRLGLDRPTILMACLFHQPVAAAQRQRMERNGWKVVDLPRNPHHPR